MAKSPRAKQFKSPDLKTDQQIKKERDTQYGNRGFLNELANMEKARTNEKRYQTQHANKHTYKNVQQSPTEKTKQHRDTRINMAKQDPTKERDDDGNTGFCDQVNMRGTMMGRR